MLVPCAGLSAIPIDAPISIVTVELKRLAKRHDDPSRDSLRDSGRADARYENGELIPGQARQQRAAIGVFALLGGDHYAQPVGDHDQQLIAAGMAKAVVDTLEAVEVDEQHRRHRAGRRGSDHLVRLSAEMEPVGKRRDRVIHAQRMGVLY